jgi:hypothetical protein
MLGLTVAAVSVMAASACGGGVASGSGSVSGDDTYGFNVQSAFLVHYASGTNPDLSVPEILLTDQAWSCDDLKASGQSEPGGFAIIALGDPQGTPAAGTFTITGEVTPTTPFATFEVVSASTDEVFNAGSGSVTVSDLSADHAAGTFDLSNGDVHLTGSFDAPACDLDLSGQG